MAKIYAPTWTRLGSASKIADPHEITSPVIAFAIFAIAIVFEAFALRTAVRHAQPERRGRSWVTYIRTSRSPELPVLLLEDSGALIGLVFATTGSLSRRSPETRSSMVWARSRSACCSSASRSSSQSR